jgi:hypothetical protein
MESFYCITDKSGSMSVLDKEQIIKHLKRTLCQVSEYSREEDKFKIFDVEWDGKSESLFPLIQKNNIKKFMLMTDGYSLDSFYNYPLKKKEFQKQLTDSGILGCIVLVGIDASEERIPVVETFPAYCILEALDYVLQK